MSDREKIKELLKKLFGNWGDWHNNKKYYLESLLPNLLSGSEKSPTEVILIGNIKQICERQKGINIKDLSLEVVDEIESSLARQELDRIAVDQERELIRKQAALALAEKRKEQIRLELLANEEEKKRILSRKRQAAIDEHERDKRRKLFESKRMEIIGMLTRYEFKNADNIYYDNKPFLFEFYNEEAFEKDKAVYISRFLQNNDTQQTNAIGAYAKNVLVSARAGSGKTHTISGKVAYLCDKYGINPGEVLVLCFNKSAAENMRNKIKNLVPTFENAMTFHSWAWSIVKPEDGSVMFDTKGDFSPKKYSSFIREIISEYSKNNVKFREEVYDFFKEENEELDESVSETKYFSNREERYHYLRNKTFMTLSGNYVKSRGEKWIADFLFEHGIDFYYEQQLGWNKITGQTYHPDFTIRANSKKYILEHWGIDENDQTKSVPEFWKKTWNQYRDEMYKKREFFAANTNYGFIETSIRDINYNLPLNDQRGEFEMFLNKLLSSKGISCKKLPKEDLINKAWEIQLFSKLDTLAGQFIGWMQKNAWDENTINERLSKEGYSSRQRHFCSIGLAIYHEYEHKLRREEKIDFNILIAKAIKMIKSGEYDVSKYKYILIDEFQDFSGLFQNLIDAVTETNSDISLFCVGDSWQLINGFAGSDLKYFDTYMRRAKVKTISTCYRSERAIIHNGNNFADKYQSTFSGERSRNHKNQEGFVHKYNILDTWIENDSRSRSLDDEYKKPFRKSSNAKDGEPGQDFMSPEMDIQAKYLKTCVEIIEKHPDRSFLFLSRNTKINGLDIYEFKDILLNTLKNKNVSLNNEKDSITCNTMHSSKGLEADIVVLLNVCEKVLPSIHPSNELFEIFGRTPDKILDEEKRLFYVAITRAKRGLYVLTEKDKESEFIH